MAQKKTDKKPSTPRKQPAKKPTGGKKTPEKKPSEKQPVTNKKERTEEEIREHRQIKALLLFGAAVLVLFAVIIPGSDGVVWNAIHRFMHGLFGTCAYAVPFAIGYVAVMMAVGKRSQTITKHVVLSSLLVLIVEVILEIFLTTVKGITYGQALSNAYSSGADGVFGGGIFGALIGYPMELLLSDICAKITIIVIAVVVVMLITRVTLVSIGRSFKKTADYTRERVKKTREKLDEAYDDAATEPVPRKTGIDIDLGEGYVDDGEAQPTPQKSDEVIVPPVDDTTEEADESPLDIDDIIGQAIKKKAQAAPDIDPDEEDMPPDYVPPMTDEELQQEEEAIAQEIEEQTVVEEYRYPPLSLLSPPKATDDNAAREEMQTNAELLVQTLKEFGISAKVIDISRGPSVTRYELQPNAGVKISRITGLADDIALRLATTGVRIEAPIPNKAAIGIEVPNKIRGGVSLRELIGSEEFTSKDSHLTVALGRDISGQIVTADLAKMPHLLIAGTTGSGKSVCTNSMIQSVLFRSSPEEVRMILIDPKRVEFSIYNGIPHLLIPVVTDPRKAAGALGWAVTEMLNRYNTFAENGVRDLKSYNKLAEKSDTLNTMPLILIVIDELSDLMMAAGKEVEDSIVRLAQMARAAGMHLVIATQRPSVDVITGLIKANIPSRLGMTVATAVDSRTILDAGGAEKLLGSGDMLFHPVGLAKPVRLQGGFVSDDEVAAVVDFLKGVSTAKYDEQVISEINRQAEASEKSTVKEDYDDDETDELLPQAIEFIIESGQASVSGVQRRFKVGYARAGRLIDEMEQRGVIGPHEGSKARQVLMTREQWLEMQHNQPDSNPSGE